MFDMLQLFCSGDAEAALDLAYNDLKVAVQLHNETAQKGGIAECAFSLWLHRLQGDNIERQAPGDSVAHGLGRMPKSLAILTSSGMSIVVGAANLCVQPFPAPFCRAEAAQALLHFEGRGRAAHQYALAHHRC